MLGKAGLWGRKSLAKERLKNLRKYGLTIDDYAWLFKAQKGRCAICQSRPLRMGKPLGVDHNHLTGEVRGLLCDRCNSGLGFFEDNPVRLRRALRYLIR